MKPFYAGRKAFYQPTLTKTEKGVVLEGNPYKRDTKDWRDWEFGYNRAYYDNLQKIRARGTSVSS